jgi:hypothetical protein
MNSEEPIIWSKAKTNPNKPDTKNREEVPWLIGKHGNGIRAQGLTGTTAQRHNGITVLRYDGITAKGR